MDTTPEHLMEKYRLYAIWFDGELNSGRSKNMLIVHIARPMSLKTLCEDFLFKNIELTIEKTNQKLLVSKVVGVQKVMNDNVPDYELVYDGVLKEIR